MRLNTFLNFGGNCEEAFRFYEQHLGGRIMMLMRRAEQPDQPITWPGWENSIQYAFMDLGETQNLVKNKPPAIRHLDTRRLVLETLPDLADRPTYTAVRISATHWLSSWCVDAQ